MMEDEKLGALAESPAASDVGQESSPEALEETTSQKVEQERDVPFNEHPRFKEVIEEKNYWKEAAMKALEAVKAPQAVNKVEEDDLYADMTPEEKAFFEKVDRIAEKKARKIVAEKEVAFRQELNQTRGMTAEMLYKNFLKDNPDIKPNSPEEKEIAAYVGQGYPLEHAKKIVMFDANARKQAQQVKEKINEKTKQKVEANLERTTSAPVNGIPQKETKRSVRDVFEETAKKLGL